MSTKLMLLIGAGIVGTAIAAFAVGVAGFGFVSSAFAQSAQSAPSSAQGSCHDNQSVFQLLGLNQQELLAQRQAGKSLLDIAKAKGVDEAKLTNPLVQPMTAMHGAQSSGDQITQSMRDQFAKDLRESKFGTMTDFHLGLGGANGHGMMDNANHDGMMNGATGMMGIQKQ